MTDTNEKPVQQHERVFAFWTYDKFPYALGAPGVHLSPEIIKLDGYGRWGTSGLFAYQPLSVGAATLAKLKNLEAEYREEQAELLLKYKAKALEILPALALTQNYGGNLV